MMKSMTGFGQASCRFAGYIVQMDLKSVNHRYCEVNVRIPREYMKVEDLLKKTVQQHLKRGRADLFVTIERSAEASRTVELNWQLVEAYQAAAEQLVTRFGLKSSMDVRDYMSIPDLITFKEAALVTDEEFQSELLACAEAAVLKLTQMRESEGAHLCVDIKQRIETMNRYLEQSQKLAPQVVHHYAHKLRTRIQEMQQQPIMDEARMAMEVALLADRSNIDEELVRLQSHIQQCVQLISESEPIGRKFDFLLQEMNREVNTIGSKANHAELTTIVVEMKAEMEKLREQIQNIE
ncbi:YicC/YloC family endoribonuclease [Paenibacillus sp. FSL H8-0034]|uniref:YicC/YloC family endoribonuclease n=1 Tax=Paenibacillus sp. FSL H8-0034 TaxID=2954671 RepID=UPI0040470564